MWRAVADFWGVVDIGTGHLIIESSVQQHGLQSYVAVVLTINLRGLLHAPLHTSSVSHGHAIRVHVLIAHGHFAVSGQIVANALRVTNWAIFVAHQKRS